jgi:hypothetical protein
MWMLGDGGLHEPIRRFEQVGLAGEGLSAGDGDIPAVHDDFVERDHAGGLG